MCGERPRIVQTRARGAIGNFVALQKLPSAESECESSATLGKLPPGDYTLKWIMKPLIFKQLEKPAKPIRDNKDNWSPTE